MPRLSALLIWVNSGMQPIDIGQATDRAKAVQSVLFQHLDEEKTMKAIADLFSTDYGLMSIAGIAFMIGMGVFFLRYFKQHMDADAAAEARRSK